jgi:hypothetical protein
VDQSGYEGITIYGIMGRTGDAARKLGDIKIKSGVPNGGLIGGTQSRLCLHDPGWQYTQKCEVKCPWPTHPFYDAKAFVCLDAAEHQ